MSVDQKIVEIDDSIKAWNEALFRIDAHLEGALEKVDAVLGEVERAVQGVEGDAAKIRDDIVGTTDKFPSNALYIALLLFFDLLIWIMVAFLIYKILHCYRNRRALSVAFQRTLEGKPAQPGANPRIYPANSPDGLEHEDRIFHQRPPPPGYHDEHIYALERTRSGGLLPVYEKRRQNNGLITTTYGYAGS